MCLYAVSIDERNIADIKDKDLYTYLTCVIVNPEAVWEIKDYEMRENCKEVIQELIEVE